MAKQVILGALEEVIGEYVLNIDKENLKIAALKGKIKLENVQLDGDLLGAHILGSMGLSGFGILSCWAETVKVYIPLKNIEKEPTRIEMRGCHLICLPLLPSTANKHFGAGTLSDPRCTLRTRAKRAKLARFEKNYMSGRVPDEGPVAKRILRAVRAVELDIKKKQKRRGSARKEDEDEADDISYLYSLVDDLGRDELQTEESSTNPESASSIGGEYAKSKDLSSSAMSSDLPALPRDWKVKLREKIMRNLIASMHDIHVRCEVSEGGLDFCHPDQLRKKMEVFRAASSSSPKVFDQRAFAFGVTLDDFTVRTADEKWQTGCHEVNTKAESTGHLGPNPYDSRNNKLVSWENFSMYWDDDPPFLISETPLIQASEVKMSSDKFHHRLAEAMKALYQQQEPGLKIREAMQTKAKTSSSVARLDRPHEYCWQGFSYEVRVKTSNRTEPGPISCLAEFLPFVWNIKFRPHQYVQYQKLKSAMLSQMRFDTMVKQRPGHSPLNDPKAWWKYAMRCITSRPNARPWEDVQKISARRYRYIELVLKKLTNSSDSTGYHSGLDRDQSIELLEMEDFLPIEALFSFHLAAIRIHCKSPLAGQWHPRKEKIPQSPSRARGLAKPISRIFGGISKRSRSRSRDPLSGRVSSETPSQTRSISSKSQKLSQDTGFPIKDPPRTNSLLDAMTARLGKKVWMTDFRFLHGSMNITLLSASNEEIAMWNCEAAGMVKLMGRGNRDLFFDVTKFEINDCQHDHRNNSKILVVQSGRVDDSNRQDEASVDLSLSMSLPSQPTESGTLTSFMDLPPSGVVCRLAASRANAKSTRLSFSAHPATLIWTRPCIDAVAEFFGAPSSALQTELSHHLRSVATPLARKAQLAFLSQSDFMLHLNISAPKVWVPLSPSRNESAGALFLDAGNLQLACFKNEAHINTTWSLVASDIQVNFAKFSTSTPTFPMIDRSAKNGMSSIIRPFQVGVNSAVRDHVVLPERGDGRLSHVEGSVACIDVVVSPICLNLVDAEILARSIGAWYSEGLLRMRGRVSARNGTHDEQSDIDQQATHGNQFETNAPAPFNLNVSIEKVEMALEGHSKVNYPEEQSIESVDYTLFGDFSPTRTYVVEVFNISVKRLRQGNVVTTKFVVDEVSVVQLGNRFEYVPNKTRHEATEPQYCILQRGHHGGLVEAGQEQDKRVDQLPPVLVASLYHDGAIHLDEVEVDIEAVVLRVTPTTLKDCAKGIRRIVELVQVMTREMERKVHEEGRKARRRHREEAMGSRSSQLSPTSPILSAPSELSEIQSPEQTQRRSASDSSLLFKVTVRDGTILAGRPTFSRVPAAPGRNFKRKKEACTFAVVQLLSNALVMFQSVENPDASGAQTLHVSLDNLSASVNTEFDRVSPSAQGPMIGPTGAEMRLANATEDLGYIVSHDISVNCEALVSSLTPNDLSILVNILSTMRRRLAMQDYARPDGTESSRIVQSQPFSLATYHKRGKGIATDVRIELHSFSFVVLRDFKTKFGAPEFLALKLSNLKIQLGGCVSALSGDCSVTISVEFFNAEARDWEYAIEPFPTKLSIDQMPNEVILDFLTMNSIQLNLTGIFLRDFAELDFGSISKEKEQKSDALTPSALSTVGLRRATESHSVKVVNLTGLDIDLSSDDPLLSANPEGAIRFASIGPGIVKSGTCAMIDSSLVCHDPQNNQDSAAENMATLTLKLTKEATTTVGEREVVAHLPIASACGRSMTLHVLKPVLPETALQGRKSSETNGKMQGRDSPETVASEVVGAREFSFYHAEPVVEWCMQNERLSSNTIDVYSLPKGQDLLSSSIWSPEDDYREVVATTPQQSAEETWRHDPKDASPARGGVKLVINKRGNWRRPYLKNDSPEWTDMTCILRMARERVMLPDTSWIWVNDWKVDISGEIGDTTDADGWEYQADFETFTRKRRFYVQGDSCRRRRWTRTRIVRPPRLEDPFRVLRFVWETSRDEHGNFKVEVRSHVTLQNKTDSELYFFAYSPSWDEEIMIGSALPGGKLHLPVSIASAVYIRLAKKTSVQESISLEDFNYSDHIMIIPTSYESSVWVRSSINLDDVSRTNLHFLLNISCVKGITDIYIKPVLKILNLLPCQLECNLGEVCRSNDRRRRDPRPAASGSANIIANVETVNVASGNEGNCTALDPASRPHISIRVPGYKWSSWQRIVNRKADSNTWRPTQEEEDFYVGLNKRDGETADEFKLIVCLDRLVPNGDPLVLIMSVQSGHCPTIKVYSQYWIVDKTGFGCRFCESFMDLMGTTPEVECSRRSHLPKAAARDTSMKRDMNIQGHQWSIGMSGMTVYFSLREKIAISIEKGIGYGLNVNTPIKSKWTSPMDISNVMPKTIFSVDEIGGSHRFELAMSVTVAPGLFSRTRIITLIPRYQVVNLLKRELVIAQDDCLKAETLIPSQSTVPFHWEKGSLPSKVRIGAPSTEEKDSRHFEDCWSNGRLQLDKIGITSMRLPATGVLPGKPMVVQAEVRLATKEQNSAVVIVLWSVNESSNPLYLLRNRTPYTILCRQPLQEEAQHPESNTKSTSEASIRVMDNKYPKKKTTEYNCGAEVAPMIRSFLGLDRIEEFVWVLKPGETACFGFDDPEKPHILEWACCLEEESVEFNEGAKKAIVEIDAMGTWSNLSIGDSVEVRCQIGAEYSTKTVEFFEKRSTNATMGSSMEKHGFDCEALLTKEESAILSDEEDQVSFSFRFSIPVLCISVIDNVDPRRYGREILSIQLDSVFAAFSQSREGYHEIEFRLMSLQVDNFVPGSYHPVLIFYPKVDLAEPFIHLSAVRRLQMHSKTYVFRYAAFRMLDVNIFLDRRTAETVARFIEPVRISEDAQLADETPDFVSDLSIGMAMMYARPDQRAPLIDVQTANSGRIYFEQLHLHPIRIALTFTQEGIDLEQGFESLMVFQFIRGMASIADAPLTFTSFVVAHVFESPQTLFRVIATHYSSQLTKQIFAILGSLAILGAPADFISNVGTGVRDFFYEPIQGAVHGPRQFIEGLEAGTQSLARGVFVGVVRGAANVTEVVNSNLAGLTADDDFIDERKAHQRMLTDAMSRGVTNRTLNDSLVLAGASIARGLRSGALGIVDMPTRYASKHGPVGFAKGMGKAIVGAIVKPVVGVGDAAALLMNHMSDATSTAKVLPKIPKRLRRALPSRSAQKPNCVILEPYDDRAAKAQKIVTGGDSISDIYIGHVNTPSHLVIASNQCFWAIDKRSREPWCVSWEEISHFGPAKGGVRVVVFSQSGLKPFMFQVNDEEEKTAMLKLLAMQIQRMGNATRNLDKSTSSSDIDMSLNAIPGIQAIQVKHIFGSCNQVRKRLADTIKDEIDLIEQCFERVKRMSSESSTFFETLDEEAWSLVSCWGQVFSGLSSRRCIAASVINGTGTAIQIKSTKLMEGGSPCYSIPTSEFDADQGVLHAGGSIIFFGWGVVPSLLQAGNVFMHIETNAFIASLADQKNRDTYAEALPGFQVDFLEKSYDDAGWWAKYWLLLR